MQRRWLRAMKWAGATLFVVALTIDITLFIWVMFYAEGV